METYTVFSVSNLRTYPSKSKRTRGLATIIEFYWRITDSLVREAADIMIAKVMADAGYQYVNIDDCWMNSAASTDPLRVGPLQTEP
jgi:Alpha galactosidase A